MASSWRDILNKAGEHPQVDRDRAPRGQVQHRSGLQEPLRRPPARSYSGAEARDLLELELQALDALRTEDRSAFLDRTDAVQPGKPVQQSQLAQPRRRRHTSLMAALNAVIREPAAHFLRARQTVSRGREDPRPYPGATDQRRPLPPPDMAAPNGKLAASGSWRAGNAELTRVPERAHAGLPGQRRDEGGVWDLSSGFVVTPAAPATSARPRRLRLSLKKLPSIISPKRLGWRGLLALSLSATIMGLSAYALVNRGGTDAWTKVTGRAAPAAIPSDVSVSIPLPVRRPAAFRAQSRDPAHAAAPEKDAGRPKPAPFTLESLFR
jgi:hypothetical protein